MWCAAPLPEGKLHRRKLRSDKYKPPAGRLLEFYESDSSVEADEDTDVEVGGDAGTGPDAGGAVKSWRKTRSAAAKQSVSMAAAAVSAVKAAKKKKKRKRKATSPPAVVTPSILTPRSREVESKEEEEDEAVEDSPVEAGRPARRSESLAAKRQRELIEKTSEDALRRGLEVQQTVAVTQAKMPTVIRHRLVWLKPHVPAMTR
jgi:flagellar biosynthesis GTPase FlhF